MKKHDQRQKPIEFDRVSQGATIERAVLVKRMAKDGKGVSPMSQKAILKAIDGVLYGRQCWADFEDLAKRANCSVRTAKRAVEVLADAGLIIVGKIQQKRGKYVVDVNLYTIVWSELGLLRSDRRKRQPECPGDHTRVPQGPELSATGTRAECHSGTTYTSIKSNNKSSTSPPRSRQLEQDGRAEGWEAAADRLFSLGLSGATQSVAKAQAAGMSPDDVLRLCDVYQSDQGAFSSPGALHFAITHYRVGYPADDPRFWPAAPMKDFQF